MEYRIHDFAGWFRWVACGNGLFLVDPFYADDFKKEYPDAEESIWTEKEA